MAQQTANSVIVDVARSGFSLMYVRNSSGSTKVRLVGLVETRGDGRLS